MTSPCRRSSGHWNPATRYLFISAGAMSFLLLAVRFVLPAVHFAMVELPPLGFLILSFFKPPYIYILMNIVIISILASSRFNNSSESVPTCAVSEWKFSDRDSDMKSDVQSEPNMNSGGSSFSPVEEGGKEEEEVVVDESEWSNEGRRDPMDLDLDFLVCKEKQLVSDRLGGKKLEMSDPEGHRKGVKEKVKKSKEEEEEETMDGRWMKIMKESGGGVNKTNETEEGLLGSTGIKLWKVPSLSHDEINSKADAFIKKINTLIRLQRDDSLDLNPNHHHHHHFIGCLTK